MYSIEQFNNQSRFSDMQSVEILAQYVEKAHADIFPDYQSWLQGCFACAELGAAGQSLFHRLAQYSPKNSAEADDQQFDECLRTTRHQVGLGTLFHYASEAGVSVDWVAEVKKWGPQRNEVSHGESGGTVRPMEHRSSPCGAVAERALPPLPPLPPFPPLPPLPPAPSTPASTTQLPQPQEVVNSDDKYLVTHLREHQLPPFVEQAISIANTPATQDMLLLSTLAAASGILPKFTFFHGKPRHEYHANLMLCLLAKAASGKGIMNWSRALLRPIHRDMLYEYKLQMQDYQDEISSGTKPEELERPQRRLLFIPANASASAFMEQLNTNGGWGVVMETEMDTVSQTWAQEYGAYSDVLRRAFEHETISQRRRKDDEYFEIEDPRLSVLLSGTFGQISPLIKNQENGLPSRLATYIVTDKQPFDVSVFDADEEVEQDNMALPLYRTLGEKMKRYYMWQRAEHNAGRVCHFSLTESQRQRIKRIFSGQYTSYMEQLGDQYDPTVKRMAVIIKRMGMVLTALRMEPQGDLPETISPCDDDFDTMLLLANKLMLHAALMFDMLPEAAKQKTTNRSETYQRLQLFASLPDSFTTGEFLELVTVTGIPKRTAERWLSDLVEKSEVIKERQGFYHKPSTDENAEDIAGGNGGSGGNGGNSSPSDIDIY